MENTLYAEKFQTSGNYFDRHAESIMASLSHRLQVARATNNVSLVALLEREQQQIVDSAVVGTQCSNQGHSWDWIAGFRQAANILLRNAKPKIHHLSNGGDRWWYIIDPQTGRHIYAESEAELQVWIKEHL
jgi:hypothetical protein